MSDADQYFKEHNWKTFDGQNYEKQFYEVLLAGGEIISDCWPNAGELHQTSGQFRKFKWQDGVKFREQRLEVEKYKTSEIKKEEKC